MSRLANKIRSDISSLTQLLTVENLSISSRLPEIKVNKSIYEVGWSKEGVNISSIFKNTSYYECYLHLHNNEQYNFILPDGALVQLLYRFKNNDLREQRICYFPCPKNFNYGVKNNYSETPIIRLDYNPDQSKNNHSAAHLHLGFNINCRIPTSAPIDPYAFMLFILKSFYTEMLDEKLEKTLMTSSDCFLETILDDEKNGVHIKIPHISK